MAGLELVTGYRGVEHVTAPQWADLSRGTIGDSAILPVGGKMKVNIQTANEITISDGVVVYDGREFYIGYGSSVNLSIKSGSQGMLRRDIVVVKYSRDQDTGVESCDFEVVEGTPSESNPTDPKYSATDIRTGVFNSQKPFCRVRINGTDIEGIDMLVKEVRSLEESQGNLMSEVLNMVYPIGSIYMSTSSANPSSLFGGTWIQWGKGRVPVGIDTGQTEFNSVEKTGGVKTVNVAHTHTVSHAHSTNAHSHTSTAHSHVGTFGYDENCFYTTNVNGDSAVSSSGTNSNGTGKGYVITPSGSAKTNTVRISKTSSEKVSIGNASVTVNSTSAKSDSALSPSQSILQPYITCYMWKRTA